VTLAACGGAALRLRRHRRRTHARPGPLRPTVDAVDAEEKTPPKVAAAAATTREIPSACEDKAACVPPTAFRRKHCASNKVFGSASLLVCWAHAVQHLYVKAEDVEPVNPYGGDQSETWMHFGEEVVLLRRKQAGAKGVQVSGPADVTCCVGTALAPRFAKKCW